MAFDPVCAKGCSAHLTQSIEATSCGVAHYNGGAIGCGTNSETWGVGKRFGILNIGQDKFTWYATLNVPSNHQDATCGRKCEIQQAFDGWHDPVTDLIEATAEDAILKNGAYDNAPLRRW